MRAPRWSVSVTTASNSSPSRPWSDRPLRPGRSPRAPICPPSASARAMTVGQPLEGRRDRFGDRPAVGDRERGLDHIAIGEPAQRRGAMGVGRGHRGVPRPLARRGRAGRRRRGWRGGWPASAPPGCGPRDRAGTRAAAAARLRASRRRAPWRCGAAGAPPTPSGSAMVRKSPVSAASSASAMARLVASDSAALRSSAQLCGRKRESVAAVRRATTSCSGRIDPGRAALPLGGFDPAASSAKPAGSSASVARLVGQLGAAADERPLGPVEPWPAPSGRPGP